jgi:RecJ-like exonuclease
MSKAVALNILECQDCKHSRQVTHQWLEEISKKYNQESRLWEIDLTTFKRLVCEKCNSRNILVKIDRNISIPSNCPACNGSGGLGTCSVCGGYG